MPEAQGRAPTHRFPRSVLPLLTGRAWLPAAGTALLLAAAFLLAPPMGTDLAAQVARAEFADRYAAPVDLGWYGGVDQYGYSLFVARLAAWTGPRPLGAVAAVLAAGALGWLFARHRARRPVLAGVLGAVVLVGNLVSGRITFAVGWRSACSLSAWSPLIDRPAPGGWFWPGCLPRSPPGPARSPGCSPAWLARPCCWPACAGCPARDDRCPAAGGSTARSVRH